MGKEYLALIGVCVGAVVSVIISYMNSRSQQQSNRHNLRVEELRLTEETNRTKVGNTIIKLEEASALLSSISTEFSQTGTYIAWSDGMSVEEYNKRYLEKLVKLQRLTALVDVNFPELVQLLDQLNGSVNVVWGNQHSLLHRTHEEHSLDNAEIQSRVIKATKETTKIVTQLRHELRNVARQLTTSLN